MDTPQSASPELDFDNIRVVKVLGKGAMGTVFLVHDRSRDPSACCPFALKVVDKSSLHRRPDAYRRARWEVSVLTRLSDPSSSHPFLPSLLGSFETHEFLGWAVPFCPGGDLNVLRYRQTDHVFSQAAMRFYLAEIICALEHLHGMGIAYRDLKPENILIRQSGHVTLTDFDLSRNFNRRSESDKPLIPQPPVKEPPKKAHRRNFSRQLPALWTEKTFTDKKRGLKKAKSARVSPVTRRKTSFADGERSNSFVGTEEYVAPEIVRGEGHEFAVDWWALGVLAYEMLYGTTPFRGKNKKETFQKILFMSPELPGKPNPLTDLIGKLLEKDPTRRLGYRRGACEIKEHKFFLGLKWDLLTDVLRPPFLPSRDAEEIMEDSAARRIDIKEYFQRLKVPASPLYSPSHEERRHNVSLTEF